MPDEKEETPIFKLSGIKYDTGKTKVEEFFSNFGKVKSIVIDNRPRNSTFEGVAYCELKSKHSEKKLLKKMSSNEFDGKPPKIEVFKKNVPRIKRTIATDKLKGLRAPFMFEDQRCMIPLHPDDFNPVSIPFYFSGWLGKKIDNEFDNEGDNKDATETKSEEKESNEQQNQHEKVELQSFHRIGNEEALSESGNDGVLLNQLSDINKIQVPQQFDVQKQQISLGRPEIQQVAQVPLTGTMMTMSGLHPSTMVVSGLSGMQHVVATPVIVPRMMDNILGIRGAPPPPPPPPPPLPRDRYERPPPPPYERMPSRDWDRPPPGYESRRMPPPPPPPPLREWEQRGPPPRPYDRYDRPPPPGYESRRMPPPPPYDRYDPRRGSYNRDPRDLRGMMEPLRY